MRILWLCNLILPAVAKELGLVASNKEGWVVGLAEKVLKNQKDGEVTFAIAAPVPGFVLAPEEDLLVREFDAWGGRAVFYGFREDTDNPHRYDAALEGRMRRIVQSFQPQVVHCFGTEFPHTLAMCRSVSFGSLLVTIQGLCTEIAEVYEADLPKKVVERLTLRDFLKKDGIAMQKEKFRLRGNSEREALRLAGSIGGRTAWDKAFAERQNPKARYFQLNETLRSDFYDTIWDEKNTQPHSIFLSQGDYPLKGLHYVLLAMPQILKQFSDAKIYVAGNGITAYETLKQKLKISSYGKYLRELVRQYCLEDRVFYLGRLSSAEMKEQYLRSSLFLCPSAVENSPNSLGEAMLLGMPCIAANVGGIPSMFTDGEDGILFEGHQAVTGERLASGNGQQEEGISAGLAQNKDGELARIANNLAMAVIEMWSNPEKEKEYCRNAREHAMKTHDGRRNYQRTMEVYAAIAGEGSEEHGAGREA